MNVLEKLLGKIIGAGRIELNYIETLCEKHQIEEIDFDELKLAANTENVKSDGIIMYLLYLIAEKFIVKNLDNITEILGVEGKDGLEEYREENDMYHIHADGHASSVEFENEKINTLFDDTVDISREED